jgi:hypothetical protein
MPAAFKLATTQYFEPQLAHMRSTSWTASNNKSRCCLSAGALLRYTTCVYHRVSFILVLIAFVICKAYRNRKTQ